MTLCVCVYVCTHPEKRSPAKTSRQHVCRSNHPQTVSLNTINNMPARHIPSPGVRPAPGTSSPALHPTNKRGRPTYAAVSHQNVALERRPSAMLGRHRDRPLFAAVAFVVRRVVTDPAPRGEVMLRRSAILSRRGPGGPRVGASRALLFLVDVSA